MLEAAQASAQGEALHKLSEPLSEAQEKFAAVRLQFGARHPEYKKAAAELEEVRRLTALARENIARRVEIEYRRAMDRETRLQKVLLETKAEFDRVNARSLEYQALKREAEADRKLYEELVRKIREAGINSTFQSSSIRLADPARPPLKPVFPNIKLNALLAFLFSTVLAVGAVALRDALDDTIRDPDQVARDLGTQLVGNLPVVKRWRNHPPPLSPNGKGPGVVLPDSPDNAVTSYVEAIRTLRSSILLTDFDRRITSASPGEGKSTIAAHLAIAHAEQGHRTLLIDGDLRRPSVHRRFNLNGVVGLSNALVESIGWRQTLFQPLPGLVGKGLLEILDEASQMYDLVILDAPPLLGFAEPLQMAIAVDGVVIVARAGCSGWF